VATVRFTIEGRPPLRLDLTVWALRRRPHNTIDAWDGTTYTRTLVVDGVPVHVAVRRDHAGNPARTLLCVEVRRRGETPIEAGVAEVRCTIERMLGLHVDLAGFYELAASDRKIAEVNWARRFSHSGRGCLLVEPARGVSPGLCRVRD